MNYEIEKGLKTYRNIARKALKKQFKGKDNCHEVVEKFLQNHAELVANTDFGENNYKLHFMSHIIIVASWHKTLLEEGYSKEESCAIIRKMQAPLGKVSRFIYNFFDFLPFGYRFIRSSLMNDMTGENGKNFESEFPQDDENGFSYIVHKCVYVDTFRSLGYPELIRPCCDNDIWCFSGMHRHVKWTRKCNVGDKEGIDCYDVFLKI